MNHSETNQFESAMGVWFIGHATDLFVTLSALMVASDQVRESHLIAQPIFEKAGIPGLIVFKVLSVCTLGIIVSKFNHPEISKSLTNIVRVANLSLALVCLYNASQIAQSFH